MFYLGRSGKWTCDEAYLETLDGHRLFSYAENPLHVVSYSLPYEGIISREELLEHLHVHPRLHDAVPFVFKYYQRDWGLCCTQRQRGLLADDQYRVVIRSRFEPGTLKVGEVVIQGDSRECIVFCAHLCHPAMANDDLTGVVVGLDVMRTLLHRPGLRYTYRFLIVPETVGSAAFLSHHEELLALMRGGMFLDVLGTTHPHGLQHSLAGNSAMDLCAALVMREMDPGSWTGAFLTGILNDERMFNAHGVGVPMVSLSRVLPKGHSDWPYREYHSSADNPDGVHWRNLTASRDLVQGVIRALERNAVPVPLYKGELFCSRYPSIDYRRMRDLIHSVPYFMDGRRTVAEIAHAVGHGFFAVADFIDVLVGEGLVRLDWPQEPSV